MPAGESVRALAQDYWDLVLRSDPRGATSLGDHRYDAEVEDASAAGIAKFRSAEHAILDRVAALDGRALNQEDRLTREVLVAAIEADLDLAVCHLENWQIDHLYGVQVTWADMVSAHPLAKAQGVRDLIARYRKAPAVFAQYEANLDIGLAHEWVAAEVNLTRLVSQLDAMLAAPLTTSPFFPADIAKDLPSNEREALSNELREAVQKQMMPALQGYRDFVAKKLLPKARKAPGLSGLPFGVKCYTAEITNYLGEAHAPEELHKLGLQEVDRIRAEMKILASKAGYASIREYAVALDKDPKQHVKTREELVAFAQRTLARAQAAVPQVIGHMPVTKIELRQLEAYREKESPAAYYGPAPEDHSRPAYYWLNTYKAETRPLFTAEALAFHEGVPGHHIQLSVAHELKDVPVFRREASAGAFVEGWALYAERLAKELGLYSSVASEFGRLTFELWRAERLVIDTGLHAMGWSREQAVKQLGEGVQLGEVDVANEVDRYITWPGQALSYKVGELEFRRLRALAEQKLGARFSERAFHDEVLCHGPLPLPILARVVERWIEMTNAEPPK